jgi:ParB/RepB/Spo0J family partition protein
MKAKLKNVLIKDIIVEDRFRVDLGGKKFELLKESIADKGILQPITLNTELKLLAGGRRYQACVELGIKEIPAIIRAVEEKLDELEIELFENIHRCAMTWVEENNLIRRIHTLYKEKYGDDWSQRKTAVLLDQSVAGINDAIKLANACDMIPELSDMKNAHEARKTVKKLQENAIVQNLLGENRINSNPSVRMQHAEHHYQLGDAFEGLQEYIDYFQGENVGSNIQFFEVDPPYGISLNKKKGKSETTDFINQRDYHEIEGGNYVSWVENLCKLLYKAAGRNCWLIFWFGQTWFSEVKQALTIAGWQVQDIPAIWVKANKQSQTFQPEIYLGNLWEPFFICRKGEPLLAKRGQSNVFTYAPVPAQLKNHPTERPIGLMEDILSTFNYPKTLVCSPFLGSGNTLKASYNLDMSCFGWDLSEEYRNRFLISIKEEEYFK